MATTSSTSSGVTATTNAGTSRITGLVSGLDTDSLVKSMLSSDQTKIDAEKQARDYMEWQKDAYMGVSSTLRGLQSSYFDVLNQSSNLRSSSLYNVYAASVTSGGTASTDVSAVTSATSSKSEIRISEIAKLATKDTWNSSGAVATVGGNPVTSISSVNAFISGGSNSFNVTVDGTTKSITLSGGYSDIDGLKTDFQNKLNSTFGSGNVTIGTDSTNALTITASGHSVSIGASANSNSLLTSIGLYDGASNVLSGTKTLAAAFDVTDSDLDFSINGVSASTMGITSSMSISDFTSKINSSAAGVTMSYSSITNKFTMASNSEGAVNNITLTDADSFFANKLKLDGTARTQGQDAAFTINGVATTRSSNTVTVDGTTLTFKNTHAAGTDIVVGITSDPTSVVSTIKGFVQKYNDVLSSLSSSVSEDKYYAYKPLTDAQKENMTETQITAWEKKAKSGLLSNDQTLVNLQTKMRRALQDPITGVSLSLSDIGITTSTDYKDNGKLVLDEKVLTQALKDHPEEIKKMFSAESTTTYSDTTNRTTRYNENGYANRLNDLMNDNIRITKDTAGLRGSLIEKAGYELDPTEGSSQMAKQLVKYDSRIADMITAFNTKETNLYTKFSNLETALQKLNSQSSYFSSMTSSG